MPNVQYISSIKQRRGGEKFTSVKSHNFLIMFDLEKFEIKSKGLILRQKFT